MEQPPSQTTLLVVDDDDDIRTLLSDLLEAHGYVVRTATNGAIALAILSATPTIGLVLLDIMMPDMNGWQFLALQRHDPALVGIPVIALSASTSVHGRGLPYDVPFIQKPFALEHLLALVARTVGPPLLEREVGS